MGTAEEVQECFEHWKEAHGYLRARLDEKRRAAVRARLRDGYSVQDIRDAISGCRLSPFHMGENDRRIAYNDLELICRDSKHMDEFIAIYDQHRRKEEARLAEQEKRKREQEELDRERAARRLKVVQDGQA